MPIFHVPWAWSDECAPPGPPTATIRFLRVFLKPHNARSHHKSSACSSTTMSWTSMPGCLNSSRAFRRKWAWAPIYT
jgi:hypothetical protein